MKLLRFLLLIGAILIAYVGQFLLDPSLLHNLPVQSPIEQLPGLRTLLSLPRSEVIDWGAGLLVVAGLLFGLLATAWPRLPATSSFFKKSANGSGSARSGVAILVVALILGAFNVGWIATDHAESRLTLGVWFLGAVAVLVGGWLLARTQDGPKTLGGDEAGADQGEDQETAFPEAGWPVLAIILAVVLLVSLWRLAALPVEIDGDTASHGLQALEMISGRTTDIFAPGWANIPLLAFVPAALGMMFSDNLLVGLRLAGVYAGLLTVFGTWLLGCEIFRRPPRFGPQGEVIDDDGRWGALMAAGVVAGSVVLLHYSRIPEYLEPVGWGALGLWAFLRGLRTRDAFALAASGLLIGVASSFYFSGRIFLPIVLVWTLGVLLLRRDWLRVDGPGSGWQGLGVWAVGFFAVLSPLIGYWLQLPRAFMERTSEVSIFNPAAFQHLSGVFGVDTQFGIFLGSLRQAVLTFNLFSDKSSHFGFAGPMLNSHLSPILALGVGVALIYLFRIQGWLLISWFAGVVLAGALTIDAPTWSRMLPVLPVVGLLVAFGLDRLRVSLVESGGLWLDQLTVVGAVGLILITGAQNFVSYTDYMGYEADQYSYIGRAAAQLPVDQPIWVYVGNAADNGHWVDRVPQLLSGEPYNHRPGADIGPGQWEAVLTPGSTILFHRDDEAVLAQVMARFPGGQPQVWRDKEAKPMFFAYTLPE